MSDSLQSANILSDLKKTNRESLMDMVLLNVKERISDILNCQIFFPTKKLITRN